MQNMEKYCKIKEEIRRKTKQKEDKLQKNSENNCLKKRARKIFLWKIANTADTEDFSAI